MNERRIDPDDDKVYTWEEFCVKYGNALSQEDLRDYWQTEMFSASSESPTGAPEGGPVSAATSGEERRVDPEDGKAYTWNEFYDKYKGAFELEDLQDMWAVDMQPAPSAAAVVAERSVASRSAVSAVSNLVPGAQNAPSSAAGRGERRVDPDDDVAYTWDEFCAKYKDDLTQQELTGYWDSEMIPASEN